MGLGLSTFLSPYLFSPPSQEEIQKPMLSFLTYRPELTPEQQEQVKPIADDFAQQVQNFHEQSISQFSQLAAMKEERISKFLTPEQKDELLKLAEEREKLFAKHGPPPSM